MTNFLMINNTVNNTIQKGFWPCTNGVTEHTFGLSHIIDDARRHQKSVVVTLLDLRNAFGEVSHKLISKSLELHSIPPTIINLVENIYNHANVSICVNKMATNKIKVGKGVLQGDPCSPILFNICFNTLIRTIAQDKFKSLGVAWGPSTSPSVTSWLQFADDAALIAHDCKSAQALVDIALAWCNWANMLIRIDKCVTFGMAKIKGVHKQIDPKIYINSSAIPSITTGNSFKYLGKIFTYTLDNSEIKELLVTKVKHILDITSALKTPAQLKLKIIRQYLPSQINFDLRLYNLSYTWITNNLDSMITNHIRSWLNYPVNTCVAEIAHLPFSKGGLKIPSLRSIAEKHCLSVRASLKKQR